MSIPELCCPDDLGFPLPITKVLPLRLRLRTILRDHRA